MNYVAKPTFHKKSKKPVQPINNSNFLSKELLKFRNLSPFGNLPLFVLSHPRFNFNLQCQL